MRIEELILEGFKSYPVRTTITGWDASFNAITGLNGSGKSNILDAICFVLGITNMTSVRANNLMDLIYKRGQAGVTKASVTIVFNNADRATSPVGFENTPQITVTRQIAVGNTSKYLLNGHKSTLQALQNLFQSVQLNINNPNFLIMQGKITKVLNMRPAEILGMVEEAAGTRMFEERKDKNMKVMAKKVKKVEELGALLREEIDPKLEKLRQEKREYLAYQKTTSELEHLTRLVKAYEWHLARQKVEGASRELEARQAAVRESKEDLQRFRIEQQRMEASVAEMQKQRDKEMAKGSKGAKLADHVNELERELVRLKTQAEIKESTIVDETKRVEAATKAVSEAEKAVTDKQAASEANMQSYATEKQAFDALVSELEKSEELLQTLLTGLSANSKEDGEAAGGYMGQLAEAKARMAAAGTEAEQAKVKIGGLEKDLNQKEPKAKSAAKDGEGLAKEFAAVQARLEQLKATLAGIHFDEERETSLRRQLAELTESISKLVERRDAVRSNLMVLDFAYSDPYPGFDRSKVKGLVANLVGLDESKYANSMALEIAAGGKLYNVVVTDDQTGSALIEKGQLRKRITAIPMNKIAASGLSADRVAAAKRLAPGKVDTALSLVDYPQDVASAMVYVFGDTLVCANKDVAHQITYDKTTNARTVTLEGDLYEPGGTMSGGSAPSSSGILVKAQELRALDAEIAEKQAQRSTVTQQLKADQSKGDTYRQAKRELDLKQHEANLLQQQIEGSSGAKALAEIQAIKLELEAARGVVATAKDRQKAGQAEIKRLEKEMADFRNNKDAKLNEIKADIAKRKKEVSKHTATTKARQKEVQTAELEIEQMRADVESAKQEVDDATMTLVKVKADSAALSNSLVSQQAALEKAEAVLRAERAALNAFDEGLRDLDNDLKQKKQEIADGELALKRFEHDLALLAKEQSGASTLVNSLEEQFTWIRDESRYFGKAGTPYDFNGVNLTDTREKTRELEAQHKALSRKVNKSVMNMLDSVEKKEQAVKKMMMTVLKDKQKIEGAITQLDQYKRDALVTTWEKVNSDFGPIFAELLPGNFAKLQPPEGQDVTQGLEVKVRLGSVWKASLTELSGGQRSLIALSLIMSLLQFKPAPMYILDEIDSALDLSHTQHIGQLFRNRFKGSQFIVVSLKEGLFTNANVLFRARFRDGTSVVERTATRTLQGAQHDDKENQRSTVSAGKGKKGPTAAGRAPLVRV